MARELILYCDESDISGKHYGNFYGGALVESRHLAEVERRIDARFAHLNLHDEVKWQKISAAYADKYIAVLDEAFDLAAEGKIKLRIMFTQNYWGAGHLTAEQRETSFFRLYYQFIKHAFGLAYAGSTGHTRLRILFDKLPDTDEKCAQFKGYLTGLTHYPLFRDARLSLSADAIAEVDSKHHRLMQCVDVVLGAMQFRLNDKHLEKPAGSRTRGKRTIAKERVYRHALKRIRQLHANFNIGISTGTRGDIANRWHDPYRHWQFVPDNAVIRPEFAKRKK
ncbi:MAG TPA: DUF3800 domain-containing protein [Pseudoxanthomonas sp.]|nr:DUF3800 domain-containing protein [Pseudoxanthomonas sp.]